MTRIVFEDDEAWKAHLSEQRVALAKAWDEGEIAGTQNAAAFYNEGSGPDGSFWVELTNPYQAEIDYDTK